MREVRRVREVLESTPTLEGAGVHLRRAFGFAEAGRFDPFLMLDDFRQQGPGEYEAGFPWHPHRGIETITYMLEGTCEHGDSMGNRGAIGPGDVQWMTAGSGVIHQEMPAGDETGRMGGLQLWANLPASHKMMDARYQGVDACDIPVVADGAATIRVVAGSVAGASGPVRDVVIEPQYLDVSLPEAATWEHALPRGHTAFVYVLIGAASLGPADDERSIPALSTALLATGDSVRARAGEDGARFLLISGRPLGEPIAWRGPIVMNTRDELRVAFEEYHAGTFVRHGEVGTR